MLNPAVPIAPILTLSTPKDVVSHKDAPLLRLGVPKTKFYLLTLFPQKKTKKNSLVFDVTKNFGSKRALTWETSPVNTPETTSTPLEVLRNRH